MSPHGEPLLGIVLVNYASSALLATNLVGRRFAHSRIVVVDNFSTTEERERVRSLAEAEAWTLVEAPDNRGFGPGVNQGVAVARELGCVSVLLLNPDLQVEPSVVDSLRTASLENPDSLFAPRLVDPSGRTVFAGHLLDLRTGRIANAAKASPRAGEDGLSLYWLTAACLAVHLDLWERLEGFDEGYFMYWEDVDFGHRSHRAGARAVLRSDLTATHDQGGTQGERQGRAKSPLYYRYNTRNRMVFAARRLSRGATFRWLLATPKVGYEIWLHGGRRQLWEAPRGALAAVRGTCSALLIGLRSVLGRPGR